MKKTKRQLYILCDMEGASGISPANRKAMHHGSEVWRSEGRALVTSDVKAVCDAANEFGIDEILIEDEHDNGKREPNLLVTSLPSNARVLRRPHLPGKARKVVRGEPFGMIFVGQHAMYGGGGFAPHTIQSPPIGAVTINGVRVGEIGLELAKFMGVRLLAVVGDEAAIAEAKALCPQVVGIPVKSLERDWFPSADETRPAIRRGVLDALRTRDQAGGLQLEPPYRFVLAPANGYVFDPDKKMPLRWVTRFFFRVVGGQLCEQEASWETKTVLRGLYALHCARVFLTKKAVA
jgi:D-aminopeptidase